MTDVLLSPIRLNDLEILIEKSVTRAIKKNNLTELETQNQYENPLDIKDVSKLIKKTVPTIYGYCQRNEIPYSKNGNRLIFWKSEIIEWLKKDKIKTLQEIESDAKTYLNKNKL
ncbi:helix-turn-helix domain-containing protein [Tenacibaculum piscium]|uniref:helix-turn-helix domain-containing protein n=1 Tax=Tenacibaculum piscium TaxID=1458515 RepID=UPI001F164603|nr:helix-turn-helix domain-containing protein [Tenacibaculum piscium]